MGKPGLFPAARPVPVMLAILVVLVVALALSSTASRADTLPLAIADLNAKSFDEKALAINALAALGDVRARRALEALLEGDLYYRRSDDAVFIAERGDGGYNLFDPITGDPAGAEKRRGVKKISINNSLRRTLRAAIAGMALYDPDADRRRAAALELIRGEDAGMLPAIDAAVAQETDESVREAFGLARASLTAKFGDDANSRIEAIGTLAGILNSDVLALLGRMADVDDDATVRDAAASALAQSQSKADLYGAIETLFFGISLGSVLLLAAVGLAVTFGVMGVINMAHGEMIMLGAYTTYLVQQAMPTMIDTSIIVAIPAAFAVTFLVGVAIERSIIRLLYGRPLETLLATFGLSLILQQAVRSIFTALNREVSTPSWMSGTWEINAALSLTLNRLYIIAFAVIVVAALMAMLRYTRLGLQIRAVTQNRAMAASMGIRTGWVDAVTFGIGSGIAGVAGVALSQLTNVGPNLGQGYIVDSFMVVVFGGVGNLWGTVVGALSLGVVNKLIEPISGAVLAKIIVLVLIILFIQKRPRGLFALKGRAVES